ncbi:MAG: FecR domain-containing protein [Aquabacterium sp.]|uniref:FecR family protein n=1 Tax=Aquabacterium sp. TaxID=1872578 RepID=UPI002720F9DA|nr:FecR domain-containing protein [Aquabacterium sp.]MDO9002946.1 FecR domain-containing protein [Aquabacterium sp.]
MARARPEKLVEHALTLIVLIEGASPEAAQQARLSLEKWRTQSPENLAAEQEARQRWNALFSLSSELRSRFHEPGTTASSKHANQRRHLLLSAAAIAGTGTLTGLGIRWQRQQPVSVARHQTATAQLLKVDLEDGSPGSQVALSPQSDLEVRLYRQRRVVNLSRGEVRFDVQADAERPFEVLTRELAIEVVGTAFTVRDRGGPVFVGVEHGQVRVRLRPQNNLTTALAQAIDLLPGQGLTVRNGRPEQVRTVDVASLSAWRDGWLVFQDTPLGEALATINAYRRVPMMALASVSQMKFSGRFRASDTHGLVTTLAAILPITADASVDGVVTLRPR